MSRREAAGSQLVGSDPFAITSDGGGFVSCILSNLSRFVLTSSANKLLELILALEADARDADSALLGTEELRGSGGRRGGDRLRLFLYERSRDLD